MTVVNFEVSVRYQDQTIENIGRLSFELWVDSAPAAAHNFLSYARPLDIFQYEGTIFHRIVKDSYIQGGDVTMNNGYGNHVVHYTTQDERFRGPSITKGSLSTTSAGMSGYNSQYIIHIGDNDWMKGSTVVFGKLMGKESYTTLDNINRLGTQFGSPNETIARVYVSACS